MHIFEIFRAYKSGPQLLNYNEQCIILEHLYLYLYLFFFCRVKMSRKIMIIFGMNFSYSNLKYELI